MSFALPFASEVQPFIFAIKAVAAYIVRQVAGHEANQVRAFSMASLAMVGLIRFG